MQKIICLFCFCANYRPEFQVSMNVGTEWKKVGGFKNYNRQTYKKETSRKMKDDH